MLIFYTEREGGNWIPLRVKTTRGKLLKRLKKFAFKKLAEIIIEGEKFLMASVLFPNDLVYCPILNQTDRIKSKGKTWFFKSGKLTKVTTNYHKWLKGQLGIK